MCIYIFIQFSSVQSLSCVQLFATPWIAAHQASLSITNSWSPPELMSIESVMPSSHLILSPPSPPALNLSQHQGLFKWVSSASGGQSTGASVPASVLAMNIKDWFPLGWTGLICLQNKGLSRVFSNTTVQKHQFFKYLFLTSGRMQFFFPLPSRSAENSRPDQRVFGYRILFSVKSIFHF